MALVAGGGRLWAMCSISGNVAMVIVINDGCVSREPEPAEILDSYSLVG